MKIAALIPQVYDGLHLGELICKKCCAPHFLYFVKMEDGWRIAYDRATRRYPAEYYDEPQCFGVTPTKNISLRADYEKDRPFSGYGPILIYNRVRLSPKRVHQVWLRSGGKCHRCGKSWTLRQHGLYGWHADHDIPHSGGGRDAETVENLLIACAKCNLIKGNGRPERLVERALRALLM